MMFSTDKSPLHFISRIIFLRNGKQRVGKSIWSLELLNLSAGQIKLKLYDNQMGLDIFFAAFFVIF
jgi:hypothetical protein